MGRRKAAKNRTDNSSCRGPHTEALPTVFEAILLLPLEHGLTPLSSLLVLLFRALLWATHALFVGLVWGGGLLVLDLVIARPVSLASHVCGTAVSRLANVFFLFGRCFFPSSASGRSSSPEETRLLRASLARLEKRVKRAEHRLRQQHDALQRLLHAPSPALRREEEVNLRTVNPGEAKPAIVASAPPPPPQVSVPAPPPPPPPTVARLPLPPLRPKVPGSQEGHLPKGAGATPAVTLKDLLRVKLKPAFKTEENTASCTSDSFNTSCGRSSAAATNLCTRPKGGLSVSLADITNVQLRRAHSTLASRAAATAGGRTAGSPLKVPLGFQLKRVAGIERSPGGTPIRPDYVKSSQHNTVDKFALALKKKFESSLISSPPRSASSSPAASPILPATPISLNGSFVSMSSVCLSPSASFLESSTLSPIRPDKL